MSSKEPSKTGILITIGLLVVTWVVTIWLFHYLTNPKGRSETFDFTLSFVCFLEFLTFGYFALLFIPNFRKRAIWALYPVIGVITNVYVAVSMVIVIGYNLFSFILSSRTAYFTALTVASVVFLIVLGSIIVLNVYKKAEDIGIEKKRKGLTSISVRVQEIHQDFLNFRESINISNFRDAEADIRKLKERFQVCTPFGRPDFEVSNIEEEIQHHISSLGKLIADISSTPKEELGNTIEDIKRLAATALQTMERREKLLIR